MIGSNTVATLAITPIITPIVTISFNRPGWFFARSCKKVNNPLI